MEVETRNNGERSHNDDKKKEEEDEMPNVTQAESDSSFDNSSDNASDSSCSSDGSDDEYNEEEDEYFYDEEEMPLLKYARLVGSLPRSSIPVNSNNTPTTPNVTTQVLSNRLTASTLGRIGMYNILALGYANGTVQIVDPRTGFDVTPSHTLQVSSHSTSSSNNNNNGAGTYLRDNLNAVMDLSFDAVGGALAAVQRNGDVCVWELKFASHDVLSTRRSNEGGGGGGNVNGDTIGLPLGMMDQGMSRSAHGVSGGVSNNSVRSGQQQQQTSSTPGDGILSFWNQFTSTGTASPNATASYYSSGSSSRATTAPDVSAIPFMDTQQQSTQQPQMNSSTGTNSGMLHPKQFSKYGPRLLSNPTVVLRFSYGLSSSIPYCIALDPAFTRHRDKQLVCGFGDGRVMLTKKGGFFGRLSDHVLYQGSYGNGGDVAAGASTTNSWGEAKASSSSNTTTTAGLSGGIEALAWRGGLLAWADASGVKIIDVVTNQRIAHVDRPAGARSSLYPQQIIGKIKCHLNWESRSSLLIAWGDFLMSVKIVETRTRVGHGGASSTEEMSVVKKRVVERSMAWELDCVACGVAPLDANHVLVLGVVVPPTSSDSDNEKEEKDDDRKDITPSPTTSDEQVTETTCLELQIISRSNGIITSSDALPLLQPTPSLYTSKSQAQSHSKRVSTPQPILPMVKASEYKLLSTYTLPRMEEKIERNDQLSAAQIGELPSHTANDPLEMYQKWTIESVLCGSIPKVQRTTEQTKENLPPPIPPNMLITSPYDAILCSVRDIDDAISHARSHGNYTLALLRGWQNKQLLRKYTLNQIIAEHLTNLLYWSKSGVDGVKKAARSCPLLFMGDAMLWERWICQFAKIPGGMFALREFVPVRDPNLSSSMYEMACEKMLIEIENMKPHSESASTLNLPSSSTDAAHYIASTIAKIQAKELYLTTLRAWGPTSAIRNRIRLLRFSMDNDTDTPNQNATPYLQMALQQTEKELHKRLCQSAADVLNQDIISLLYDDHENESFTKDDEEDENTTLKPPQQFDETKLSNTDSLYNITSVASRLAPRIIAFHDMNNDDNLIMEDNDNNMMRMDIPTKISTWTDNCAIATEAMAELNFMKGDYGETLNLHLLMGANVSRRDALKNEAIRFVNTTISASAAVATPEFNQEEEEQQQQIDANSYQHVLAMIEIYNLHWRLLLTQMIPTANSFPDAGSSPNEQYIDTNSSPDTMTPPIVSLIQLVGLNLAGKFLIKNCVPTASSTTTTASDNNHNSSAGDVSRHIDAPLPLTLVASQLASHRKLLHWYLHMIFLHRPDIYVSFPNTAIPPSKEILELHRQHLELYVRYATSGDGGDGEDGAVVRDGWDHSVSSGGGNIDSPLMSFLKATLAHGGVRPGEARHLLEEKSTTSKSFARELAYVIEKSGSRSESDAKTVLALYLYDAKSLHLAVTYAESNTHHSSMLWEILITYCLDKQEDEKGPSFGRLLEAAAQCGADLAHLVSEIPEGMRIQGLRPMLVSAVADYRLRVKIHEMTLDIFGRDKVAILRELSHQSRRGQRVNSAMIEPLRCSALPPINRDTADADATSFLKKEEKSSNVVLSKIVKDGRDDDDGVDGTCRKSLKRTNRNLALRMYQHRRAKALPIR